MKNTQLSNTAANAAADGVTGLLDGGTIKIYDGTQPTTADDPIVGNELVSLEFGTPAFLAAVDGVATANPIQDALITTTGVATWFRVSDSLGNAIYDGSVGNDLTFNLTIGATNLQQGAYVSVQSVTFTALKSASGY